METQNKFKEIFYKKVKVLEKIVVIKLLFVSRVTGKEISIDHGGEKTWDFTSSYFFRKPYNRFKFA
jgi:hypothetical protein